MYLPRSRSAMAKRCPFLVLCVLLAGHAIAERLSGQVVTGQVIDSTSSVTIVVSYPAFMPLQSRRTCRTLTARSGDIRQSIPVKDTASVYVLPWHPEGIVFHWRVIRSCRRSQRWYIPGYYDDSKGWYATVPAISGSTVVRVRGNCGASSMSVPTQEGRSRRFYIEPGHTFELRCPQDLTRVP